MALGGAQEDELILSVKQVEKEYLGTSLTFVTSKRVISITGWAKPSASSKSNLADGDKKKRDGNVEARFSAQESSLIPRMVARSLACTSRTKTQTTQDSWMQFDPTISDMTCFVWRFSRTQPSLASIVRQARAGKRRSDLLRTLPRSADLCDARPAEAVNNSSISGGGRRSSAAAAAAAAASRGNSSSNNNSNSNSNSSSNSSSNNHNDNDNDNDSGNNNNGNSWIVKRKAANLSCRKTLV